MKTIKFLAMAALAAVAIVFASCGGSKNADTFEVTVDNTTIGGKLSKYFSLVDKKYKYNKSIIDKVIVELTCIEPLPENMKAYIGVEVLDEDASVISAGKPDAWSFNDYEVLRQASPGQTITIEINNHQNVGDETPAKIRLSSIVEEDESTRNISYSSYSYEDSSSLDDDSSSLDDVASTLGGNDSGDDDDSDSYSASSSSKSQDWDGLLNSYEQYVDKYISYMKKAAQGDMSALSEYPALMEKAMEFSDKMKNAQGDMSTSQWARYMRITNKMTKAATDM